jgi:curved DNA-binding protein CbpA
MDVALASEPGCHPQAEACFDLYELLGVDTLATDKEIKKSYRKQALIWHPDKNPGNAEAANKFKDIVSAYEILSDPNERAWYDENREQIIGSNNDEEDDEEGGEGADGGGGGGGEGGVGQEVEPAMDLEETWCNMDFVGDLSDGRVMVLPPSLHSKERMLSSFRCFSRSRQLPNTVCIRLDFSLALSLSLSLSLTHTLSHSILLSSTRTL